MALLSTHRAHTVCGALLLCWFSSTSLSSPAFAETLSYKPLSHNEMRRSDDPSSNPYLERRQQLQARRELPSPDLLKSAPANVVSIQPVAQPKSEPMKITIPNLKALEENGVRPVAHVAADTSQPTYFSDPDEPRQTVAEFKPLLPRTAEMLAASQPAPTTEHTTVAEVKPASSFAPEQLARLSPAAGGDTAPLIAAPDDTQVTTPATPTATAVTAEPPAPPAAQPVAAPAVQEQAPVAMAAAEAPAAQQTAPTQALDTALSENYHSDAYSEAPYELPSLQPKSAPDTRKSSSAKKAKNKIEDIVKPYSPLDTEPKQQLSSASKAMVDRIPSNLGMPKSVSEEPIDIDRVKDGLEDISQPQEAPAADSTSASHEAMGIKIEVKNRAANLDYELEKAYDALTSGQPTLAMEIYKNILTNDPNNKGALFGLATTYHRSGQIDQARVYYRKLLAIAPGHREGLNNFLVLLADEAPEEALTQMEQLAKRNPNFSPIPAQMAVINQKLGNADKATAYMYKAVELAPENLVYRYNLAIMLDKQKKYDDARKLYKQLVDAALRGEVIPGNLQKIQQRLTFISSNRQ